jgi:hypothetical protein
MIDTINDQVISLEERKQTVNRALWTNPYFYKMDFPILQGTKADSLVTGKVGIGRDFYLTEVKDNGCTLLDLNVALVKLQLYTGYNISPYNYNLVKLQNSFITTDARFRTAAAARQFQDKQFESLPFLIRQNDSLYADVSNDVTAFNSGTYTIVLKGFNICKNAAFGSTEVQQINDSLAKDVEWQIFKLLVTDTIDDEGKKQYFLENDRYPRLILGFGAININPDPTLASNMLVSITDISRQLQLTDQAIPLEYIAPRLPLVEDTHIYYLPIEYYFQPYAKLQFDINNIWLGGREEPVPNGAEIAILTRTV